MTPARFNECLEQMHWSLEVLAERLGCDESLTEAYSLGLEPVPMKLVVWLEILAQAHVGADEWKPTSLKGKRYTGLMQ
jgi:hypothetical protein